MVNCVKAADGCTYPDGECLGICMSYKQPKPLYLADVLSAGFECDMEWYEIEAAQELRRLYEENQKLRAALDEQMAGHDKTLDELRVAEQDAAANLAAIVAEIRALPTRSTGYPPYQHTPDWIKQQAADIVQRYLETRQ